MRGGSACGSGGFGVGQRFMTRARIPVGVVWTAAAMLLSACAVGPDFQHPPPPEVARYTPEPLAPRTAATADVRGGQAQHFINGRDIPGEWWVLFRSPPLNSLVKKSLLANPNLQAAQAALRQAQEMVQAQKGAFFPSAQATFNPTRQQQSTTLGAVLANNATIFNLYTAQVAVTYTLDVWGQNRRTVESLQAQADNQRFLVEAAYLTLSSNVVVAAIQEASLRGQIEATNKLIDINSKMLEVMRRQFMEGYSNRSDVAAQEAALAQVRATLPPLRKALAQQRNLLSALAGRFPSQEPLETFKLAGLQLPTELPVSLPSELVEQRPDVRSSEELLRSASAQVGVAIANMLPTLTLTPNLGYSASQLAQLISPQTMFWTLAGTAAHTVFDGFTLFHTERAAEAALDQAVATHRATVITAFQNVADSLRALQNDADALKAATEFERAAKISLDLATQQMQSGNANIFLLLNAQQVYQQAIIGLVQAQANRLSDTAALFQALGGGWWNRADVPSAETNDPVPPVNGAPELLIPVKNAP
jgi:NodT family efflux transporter outer membrane factor (OMF) lipoprotein